MVEYSCTATRTNIIFLEIIVVELRAMFKPVDGLKEPFKISLFSAFCAFYFLLHMFFHMFDMTFAVLSYFLVVADEFFSIFQVFQVSFLDFCTFTYCPQEIFAHEVFHEIRAFSAYIC